MAKLWTVPNALSLSRLFAAPVLLALAHAGAHRAFLWLLIASLVTDILDGKIARWLKQGSEFGAKLDSWADLATYLSLPVCGWWLRPEVVKSEAPFFWAVVAAWTIPVALGFVKFRALTSYHTRGAVIAAYALGGASLVVFADGPLWPFRVATFVLIAAELEEIAITFVLPRPAINVRTLADARAIRDRARTA